MTSNIVVNFTRNLVFVTAVCSAISVVNAAEIYEPSATGSSWTGAYVGAFVGAGGVVNNVEIPGLGAGNLNGLGGEGVLGGFMAGYNYQVSPNFVVGLQGDVGWSNMDIELNIPGIPLTASAGPGFLASLSLRAGWLSSENTMWYVLGGYSHAEFEASLVTPGPVVSVKQTYNGFHLGTGMETKISENMTARVEYRYTQFAGEDWGTAGFLNIEPSSHAGTIALAYNWYNPNASSAYQDYSSTADADWTGLYLGAYVGAGAMVSNIELPGLGAGNFDGLGGEGILGGLLVGYNHMTSSNFVVGIILIMVFGVVFRLLPTSGSDTILHYIMP
ncbi:MAG: outer membrane beta-barrel protein, partial [Rhizobiales bacterium]|nr:outer membrane beta-barrel protein [Hyphomicrobiales bacterium]